MAMLPKIDLILAVDSNNGMGKDGELPWSLPNEYAYYLKMTGTTTEGKRPAFIMGRKTWDESTVDKETIVKDQIVLIISRTLKEATPGAYICRSYDEAVTLLSTKPLVDEVSRIWNIGGSQIGCLGIKHPTFRRLYLTKIYASFNCDTFFPENVDLTRLKRIIDPHVPQGIQEECGTQWEVHVYENALQQLFSG